MSLTPRPTEFDRSKNFPLMRDDPDRTGGPDGLQPSVTRGASAVAPTRASRRDAIADLAPQSVPSQVRSALHPGGLGTRSLLLSIPMSSIRLALTVGADRS